MGCNPSKAAANAVSSHHGAPMGDDDKAPGCTAEESSSKSQSQHSDIVTDVKKNVAGCSDFLVNAVHMETLYDTPIEEIYNGVHDGPILGEGVSGVVRRVKHRATGVFFAVKCLDKQRAKTDEALKQLREEILLGCELSHPNIVRFEEVYESTDQIFIVQELCTGLDLYDQLDRVGFYTEEQCAKLVKQMLSAVGYLHQNGIIHRDLKAENFVFSSAGPNSELRMIDFGLSKHFEVGQHHHDPVGTPYTVAPEILHGDYTEKADMWAVGVITFLLLSGDTPFGGNACDEDILEVRKRILEAELHFESDYVWEGVSNAGKEFVKRLLDPDPERRPSAKQAQNDPWIQKITNKSSHNRKQLNPKTVKALLAFKETSTVKKLLSEALSFTLLPEQTSHVRREFETIDTAGNGEISFIALKRVLEDTVDAKALEDLFDCIKIRKSAPTLRYHEFLAAVISLVHIDDRNMRLAFERLDGGRKGFLTLDDLLDVLGSSVDHDEFKRSWSRSLKICQANPSRITIADFKNMMRSS